MYELSSMYKDVFCGSYKESLSQSPQGSLPQVDKHGIPSSPRAQLCPDEASNLGPKRTESFPGKLILEICRGNRSGKEGDAEGA
jgi:hypothetical protein